MAPSGLNSDLGGGPDQQRGRGLVGFGEYHMTPHRTGRRVVLTGTRHAICPPRFGGQPCGPAFLANLPISRARCTHHPVSRTGR